MENIYFYKNFSTLWETFEYSKKLLEKYNFELQDVYKALQVISEGKDFIQSELYKNSKNFGKRNDKILYYDCTNIVFF